VIARVLSLPVRMAFALAVLVVAVMFALLPLVTLALGAGGATSWLHRWCSPSALTAAARGVGGSGVVHGALGELAIHWPHLLPLLAGVATVRYLWRADARYRSQQRAG
jgi:hypothetical protein